MLIKLQDYLPTAYKRIWKVDEKTTILSRAPIDTSKKLVFLGVQSGGVENWFLF